MALERLGAAHRPVTSRITDQSGHMQPKPILMGNWNQSLDAGTNQQSSGVTTSLGGEGYQSQEITS